MTTDIAALEAQVEQARREEAERREREAREVQAREVQYRRARLAAYDRADMARQTREAASAFRRSLEEDPVFSAFAEAQAARWREHRAAQTAYNDAVFLANLDGTPQPPNPGRSEPPPLTADQLINAVSNLVAARVEEYREQIDGEYAAAVFGEGLSPEDITAMEKERLQAQRRAAARHVASGSVDVTGMSDDERAALGLPPGSSRRGR